MPPSRAALLDEIERAFAGIPRPVRLTRVAPERNHDSMSVSSAFLGKSWRDLTPDLIQSRPEAIAFFSPEGFRYFLPGYLLLAIQDINSLDVALVALLNALAGPTDHYERLHALTRDQLKTVLGVLEALTPADCDPLFWDFCRAKEGVLNLLTRPTGSNL
jgi:hypothetical protein